MFNNSRRRTVARPVHNGGDLLCTAGDHRLDAPIAQVAHPTGNAQRLSLARHTGPKGDALNTAGDDQVTDLNGHYFTCMPGVAPASGERM